MLSFRLTIQTSKNVADTTFKMNIYQSNNYRKDLSWLYPDNKPWIQEREQVKDKQSYISVFVATAYLWHIVLISLSYIV